MRKGNEIRPEQERTLMEIPAEEALARIEAAGKRDEPVELDETLGGKIRTYRFKDGSTLTAVDRGGGRVVWMKQGNG